MGGPVSSQGPHKRGAGGTESEMEVATLLAVTMEEEAMSEDVAPPEVGKGRKLWQDPPCSHLALAPGDPFRR